MQCQRVIGRNVSFSAKNRGDVFFNLKESRHCFKVIAGKNFEEIGKGNVVLWLLLTSEVREGISCMLKVKSRAGESVGAS